jgi:hypothetical protein
VKRIYLCIAIFAALVIFATVCEIYVTNTVRQTSRLLAQAADSRRAGDYSLSREYADSAWEKWRSLNAKSRFVLSDLTISADVTVSISRVTVLASGSDSERFIEECTATIMMLEHFIADNQNMTSIDN